MNNLFERAMKIVEENDAFYYKDEVLDGTPFRIFNYRLASYSDFAKNPFALELRGLTINLETGEYFLGLHKFFNDQENPFTMNNELWECGELLCMEKLDGSLIQCVINNGKIYAKTKGTFFSEQAEMAQKIINENKDLQELILKGYENNPKIFYYFELVSPFNQIVVPYKKTELRLIQSRKEDGEYLDYEYNRKIARFFKIPFIKVEYHTLDKLKELQKTKTGIEGWVVRNPEEPFERQFRKFKTSWFFCLHKLISPSNLVENRLIEHILNETIDDVISQLPQGEKRNKIEEIRNKVSHYFDRMYNELVELLKEKSQTERKEFAIKYKEHPYFGVLMKAKNENELEKLLKEKIIKDTSKLSKAREFLKNL